MLYQKPLEATTIIRLYGLSTVLQTDAVTFIMNLPCRNTAWWLAETMKTLETSFHHRARAMFQFIDGISVMNTESKRVLAIDMSSLIVTISQVEAISLPILVTGLFIEIWKEVVKLCALRVKFQFNGNPYGNLNRMWDGFWFFCWPTFALLEHEPF